MGKKYTTKKMIAAFLRAAWNETQTLPSPAEIEQAFPYEGNNPGRHRRRIKEVRTEFKALTMVQRYSGGTVTGRFTRSEPAFADQEPDAELPLTGTMDDPAARREPPQSGRRTFVFTCAQNNTDLIPEHMWQTLLKLVDYHDAELHVSQFTYNKAEYGRKSIKPGSGKLTDGDDLKYADEIEDYVSNSDIQITPDLVWLGSLNILPTAVNPITGFQNHTRQASCIIPHTKMAMESVATMKSEPAKLIYTTGCVTQRNYIQKTAGQKADFHHVFGAVLVEVDEQDNWWVRQLNFDQDGGLYDKNCFFTPTEVFENVQVQAITHGDIHGWKKDDRVCDSVFGAGGMLDQLMPREQYFHDIIDFMPRNHHNRKDFQFLREMHRDGTSSVEQEFKDMAFWLMHDAQRNWCESHIVVSNHDQAVDNWLADTSQLYDPANVELWLRLNHAKAVGIGQDHPFCNLMRQHLHLARHDRVTARPRIILEDQSHKIKGTDIEAGLHGHLGPNGARGNPKNLRSAGKANTAHTHSAGIVEGVYTAGVLGKLEMGYNKGLSSWSHSSTVTYPNGKRAIYTMATNYGWWRE